MMSVTSGETLNCMKEFLRVGTPSALAVFCLGKVSRVGCKAVKGQSGTKTVLARRVLPVFPWLNPARSSAGNVE